MRILLTSIGRFDDSGHRKSGKINEILYGIDGMVIVIYVTCWCMAAAKHIDVS